MIFAHFDGDDVGPRLTSLLLSGKVEDARRFSEAVNAARAGVEATLRSLDDVEILISGGDDVVASWRDGRVEPDLIESIRTAFHQASGQTLSVGIGRSTREATMNLQSAKLQGKDRMVCTAADVLLSNGV